MTSFINGRELIILIHEAFPLAKKDAEMGVNFVTKSFSTAIILFSPKYWKKSKNEEKCQ
jgi:hypothetical protein